MEGEPNGRGRGTEGKWTGRVAKGEQVSGRGAEGEWKVSGRWAEGEQVCSVQQQGSCEVGGGGYSMRGLGTDHVTVFGQ